MTESHGTVDQTPAERNEAEARRAFDAWAADNWPNSFAPENAWIGWREAWNRRSSLPPSGVRGLEWTVEFTEGTFIRFQALSAIGGYEVSSAFSVLTPGGPRTVLPSWRGPFTNAPEEAVSVEAAKAAAQADYERRILSALEAASPDEEGQALSRFDKFADSYVASARAAVSSPLPALPVPEADEADWHKLGPIPRDPVLEEKLSRVKYPDEPAAPTPPVHVPEGEMIAALKEAEAFIARMSGGGETEFRAKLRAALARSPLAEEGWRDISTAPKDGTKILVCGPLHDGGTYQDVTAWPENWTGLWPVAYMAYAAAGPTHWMPLPRSPAPTGGGQ